jgi:hypothetical protein
MIRSNDVSDTGKPPRLLVLIAAQTFHTGDTPTRLETCTFCRGPGDDQCNGFVMLYASGVIQAIAYRASSQRRYCLSRRPSFTARRRHCCLRGMPIRFLARPIGANMPALDTLANIVTSLPSIDKKRKSTFTE